MNGDAKNSSLLRSREESLQLNIFVFSPVYLTGGISNADGFGLFERHYIVEERLGSLTLALVIVIYRKSLGTASVLRIFGYGIRQHGKRFVYAFQKLPRLNKGQLFGSGQPVKDNGCERINV